MPLQAKHVCQCCEGDGPIILRIYDYEKRTRLDTVRRLRKLAKLGNGGK